ncbi:hypothetical protein [Roseateles sp.]|uniref:hypothetical protein n=1 Tax=Roseateles sp. TaxID=1971397 RepID=UPI003BA74F14
MIELQARQFEGRREFLDTLRQALLQACAEDRTQLYCLDSSFSDWPWSDVEVLAALKRWARPGRLLHLLAEQYEDLARLQPRFVQWRATWGHCVHARAYGPEALAAVGPSGPAALFFWSEDGRQLNVASAFSIRLHDKRLWRGAASVALSEVSRSKDYFDALAQRSEESFASTTLGL